MTRPVAAPAGKVTSWAVSAVGITVVTPSRDSHRAGFDGPRDPGVAGRLAESAPRTSPAGREPGPAAQRQSFLGSGDADERVKLSVRQPGGSVVRSISNPLRTRGRVRNS
jgi:hypothetical protein